MMMTHNEATALLKSISLDEILEAWESTTNSTEPWENVVTVRGWLMVEIERREPEAFNEWLEMKAPEDTDIRKLIAKRHC